MFILMLIAFFEGSDPILRLLQGYVIEGVILWAASFAFGVGQGLRAQRLPVKVGTETMLGKTVNAFTPIDPTGGKVFVEGEYWNAKSDVSIEQGQPVEITAVEGLTVRVKPQAR
jgi:membrane-bound serine protease (ClpP class)